MPTNILKNMELIPQNNTVEDKTTIRSVMNKKWLLLALLVIISIGIGYVAGNYKPSQTINRLVSDRTIKYKDVDFKLFWEVWDKLNQSYVDKSALDPEKMMYGAISGMVNSARDPYTTFFEPPENKKFQEEISGSFGGVGIEISKKSGILTVISPIKGTPAEKAGIRSGDKILKIDSKETQDLSVDEAVSLIRGRRGTTVTLTILPESGDFKDIPLIRDNIKIPTVDVSYIIQGEKRIAYIRIYLFNQIVDEEFKVAARDIIDSKADKMILDLRNNPGGLLNSAINIAGWFLTKNQIVVTEDYGNGKSDVYRADGNALLKIPMIVLINGGSASASEILAGALHDNRGIKLVGEKSFGKGSVQELDNFNDGSALKVTIAKWLTPAGISISKTGIEADIKVELPKDQKELDAIEIGKQGKDPQLDKALELLK